MATVKLIQYEDATPEVQAVFDDIKAARKVEDVNNFWKALANQPDNLKRVWQNVKEVMGAGALDPMTKELIYIAVSIMNSCDYCTHTHTAAAKSKGMTDAQYQELLSVIALASTTNAYANGLKVPLD
ncbi:MAG: carboxymuconolactone decarboxylase family protein [Saprospiraceae bacterium]|nr:carboxymuconolactone decarboxylase family protein [Saprospiraceae bacterium]